MIVLPVQKLLKSLPKHVLQGSMEHTIFHRPTKCNHIFHSFNLKNHKYNVKYIKQHFTEILGTISMFHLSEI
jgi:hypothetical protein